MSWSAGHVSLKKTITIKSMMRFIFLLHIKNNLNIKNFFNIVICSCYLNIFLVKLGVQQ